MKKLTKKQIKDIDKFCEKAHNYYELFNWTWQCADKSPTKVAIKKTVLMLIRDAEKHDYASTGGITVEKAEEGHLTITWAKELNLFL